MHSLNVAPALFTSGILVLGTTSVVAQDDCVVATLQDPWDGQYFGASVALDGDFVVVGVERGGVDAIGWASVFRRDGANWVHEVNLNPSDGTEDLHFGQSVAISQERVLVGAMGSAYVFKREATGWVHAAKLTGGGGGGFGGDVSVEGDYLVVGASGDDDLGDNSGAAYVFYYDVTGWTQQAKLLAGDGDDDDFLGSSVSVSGEEILVGARGKRAAYVFSRVGDTWTQQAKLTRVTPPISLGKSVWLDGDYAAVASDTLGVVYQRDGSQWIESGELDPVNPAVGQNLEVWGIAVDGPYVVLHGQHRHMYYTYRRGAPYVFQQVDGAWVQRAILEPVFIDSLFEGGRRVAISGQYVVGGAPYSWGVNVYEFLGGPDCNANTIRDACDVDCNSNSIPEDCEPLVDCNGNEQQDSCDIDYGVSEDCNNNGVPEECEPFIDCNGNGQQDSCDIEYDISDDCNENQFPDECDLIGGTSADCSHDGIPDECQLDGDCNLNGVSDLCDIGAGVSSDCHGNLIPDECEIADGSCQDLDGNGIPDNCECTEAMFALVPVDATGEHDISVENNEIWLNAGQKIWLHIQGCGWDPDLDGYPALQVWEATIDASGYRGGISGYLTPWNPSCMDDPDPNQYCADTVGSASECRAEGYQYFPPGGCEPAFMDCWGIAPNMCLNFGWGWQLTTPDYRFSSWGDYPENPEGYPAYAGTVVLEVSRDAVGTFRIPFKPFPATMMKDWNLAVVPLAALRPAVIKVNTGCCLPSGTCGSYDTSTCLDLGGTAKAISCQGDCDGDFLDDLCVGYEDCNENRIPDSCDIADSTSEDCTGNGVPDECEPDCNSNGVPDSCDTLNGTSEDCNGNEIPDDCDLDADCNGNGIPDECECLPVTAPAAEQPVVVPKNRYLSFVADTSNPGCSRTALRVTLIDPPDGFEDSVDMVRWIGRPHPITEVSSVGDPDVTPPTFIGAELQCDSYCMDWSDVGLVHAFGAAVLPGATYEIQAVACACDLSGDENYSGPLQVLTGPWGDLVGDCGVSPCTGPDGFVDFVDIAALVEKFRNAPHAVAKARVDIAENRPDTRIDFVDISWVVAAFRGWAYPFEGPIPCE